MMERFTNSEDGINDLLTELITVFEEDVEGKVLDCE